MSAFQLIECDWFKRRTPRDKKKVSNFTVRNFEKVHCSFCDVIIDNEVLLGRVIYNELNSTWTINAIGRNGVSINLKII